MTEKKKSEETTVPTPELPKFVTGFIVLKTEVGSWHVLTDLSAPLEITREADINEVRQGATEVVYGISNQQVAASVISALLASQNPDSAPQAETESTIEE